ncbi:MAG: DUF2378 family protein [Deltaproteobacteria bacterium]|nr:DUF2378 family protein [Deltaproteobacteria bacterium]
MLQFTTDLAVPLTIDFDLEERLAEIPREMTVKGMFLARAAGVLGSDLQAILPTLTHPPRFGRFIPFADYPVVDHMRVSVLAAFKEHPRLAKAEAIRIYERESVHTVAASTIGKVMVKLIPDVKAAYMRVPETSRMIAPSWEIKAFVEGERTVRLSYRNSAGFLDCGTIGSLEGIALMYKETPKIEVILATRRSADYIVRW